MFIVGNFLQALAVILHRVLEIYSWIVIASILISWVSADPYNPIVRVLKGMTEPVFAFIRGRLPFGMMGALDLSPIIVLLSIWFAQNFLVQSLVDLSIRLR